MPNQATIERYLQEAERHVADGWAIVAQQQRLIAQREVDGHDTVRAHALLKTYQRILKVLEAGRDQLREELFLRVLKRSLLH